MHILTNFHDDVIYTKIMAILSTGTSGISKLKPIEKETAVILKCIDQLPQNLARVHYLVGSFDRCHKISNVFYSSYCFHCLLLFFCSNFDTSSEVRDVH